MDCYFSSIGIGMEPCEAKYHTEHLFLDLAVTFLSFSKGILDGLATLHEAGS